MKIDFDKEVKRKCPNFKKCGHYLNPKWKQQKYCSKCSFIWNCKQCGYIPEGIQMDGDRLIGVTLLTREDIYEKQQN